MAPLAMCFDISLEQFLQHFRLRSMRLRVMQAGLPAYPIRILQNEFEGERLRQ